MTESERLEIATILQEYFKEDSFKAVLWLLTPNPMLGMLVPSDMITLGREKKLIKMMKAMVEGNVG